jgi:fumarate reductase flavoprotein subunit
MAASSAAVAAPLVMSVAGSVAEARAEEAQSFDHTYYINDNCILCPPTPCRSGCPASAISFDGEKMAIDTSKCIRCGNCSKVCEIGAVADAKAPPPAVQPHDIAHRECDFLVVGGGASGMIAAAIAADLAGKGKKIIVLEKARRPGGSGFYPMGIRLFSTKWQKDAGVPDQMDDYIRSAMAITRWELNPLLVENSFRSLPKFFDWFCTWGKPEEIFTLEQSRTSKNRKSIGIKNVQEAHCRPLMHRIIDRGKELGVEILTEYAATDFIMNDRGEIAGVQAKDPGGTTIIKCKYCLISTGNLLNNGSLLARSAPQYVNALVRRVGHRLPTNSGDGVLMAEKAGIPIDYNSICVAYTGVVSTPAEMSVFSHGEVSEALYVNLEGKRWANEAYSGQEYFAALLRQPKCAFYTVMDSKVLLMDRMPKTPIATSGNAGGRNVEAGVPDPDAKETSAQGPGPGGMPGMQQGKVDLKELQRIAALPGRHVVIAETLEELADGMGVDRKNFVATVKRYNELCAKGRDDDQFKLAKYMLPVEKGPFYASSHILGSDGAMGGLTINENLQLMGKNGPIDNLYASGDTTSGRYINQGGERAEIINDMSWAVASGFLAGENIGKRLKTS